MTKLVLNAGDLVRNIRNGSARRGWIGKVLRVEADSYVVKWKDKLTNDPIQWYYKDRAHINLEKVEEPSNQCKCVHDELCERCARQMMKVINWPYLYGGSVKRLEEVAEAEKRCKQIIDEFARHQTIALQMSTAPRKVVLKKDRRNVITGRTQHQFVAEMGARGLVEFESRAIGRTTGQALRILGEAMCNPRTAIRIQDVDHAITEYGTPRWEANKHFKQTLDVLIDKMGLKGLRYEHGHIIFNPIVTEETYVQ